MTATVELAHRIQLEGTGNSVRVRVEFRPPDREGFVLNVGPGPLDVVTGAVTAELGAQDLSGEHGGRLVDAWNETLRWAAR